MNIRGILRESLLGYRGKEESVINYSKEIFMKICSWGKIHQNIGN